MHSVIHLLADLQFQSFVGWTKGEISFHAAGTSLIWEQAKCPLSQSDNSSSLLILVTLEPGLKSWKINYGAPFVLLNALRLIRLVCYFRCTSVGTATAAAALAIPSSCLQAARAEPGQRLQSQLRIWSRRARARKMSCVCDCMSVCVRPRWLSSGCLVLSRKPLGGSPASLQAKWFTQALMSSR